MRALSLSRLFGYVGPPEIAASVARHGRGVAVRTLGDIASAMRSMATGPSSTFTYVVDGAGTLRIADRASEHVACAGGGPVLAAGEITVTRTGEVVDVTNLSTGYCPDTSSWSALGRALDEAGLRHSGGFDTAFEMRRCAGCGARCVVKDGVFECAECGRELPRSWNLDRTTCRRGWVRLGGRRWVIDTVEEAGAQGQDRVGVGHEEGRLTLVLADGAGGTSGGAAAAQRAVDVGMEARDAASVLRQVDGALAPSGGETTAVITTLSAGARGQLFALGASVGDSQGWALEDGGWRELSEGQSRKPLIGSGRAVPLPFASTGPRGVLLASDGLVKYAPWPRISVAIASHDPELPWRLSDLPRLRSGALPDDLAIILARPLDAE